MKKLWPVYLTLLFVFSAIILVNASASSPPEAQGVPTVVKHHRTFARFGVLLGKTLSASTGVWSNSPTGFTYQWKDCDSAGANCTNISGATSSLYTTQAGDLGHTIRVDVTASNAGGSATQTSAATTLVTNGGVTTNHYWYVFSDKPNGTVTVYDMDNSFAVVETFTLGSEAGNGIRGVSVDPVKDILYFSYGGDGGGNGNGSAEAYNLQSKSVVWNVHYSTGVDSGTLSADGSKLYLPTGENSAGGEWKVINTATGGVESTVTVSGASGPHNTVLAQDGKTMLLAPRGSSKLGILNTTTGVVTQSNALTNTVRPVTVNSNDKVGFTTATNTDGFQSVNLSTGAVLTTTTIATCTNPEGATVCSHGISITPNSKEVAVIDFMNKAVKFYDVSGVEASTAPTLVASVPVTGLSGTKSGTVCAYDCLRDGWVGESLNGSYMFVGDSEDVISTSSHTVVAKLSTQLNSRIMLEADWSAGSVTAASQRTGIGQ